MDKLEIPPQTSLFSTRHQKHKKILERSHNTCSWNYDKPTTLRNLITNPKDCVKDNLHYLLYNQEVKWIYLIFQHVKLFNIQNVHYVAKDLKLQNTFKRVIPKKVGNVTDFIQINKAFTATLSQYSPKNVFISFILDVLKNVDTNDIFSELDYVIKFSTENMIEFFVFYIYYLCNKVYKNNILQINYVFLDPGVCWLCVAVNQKYAYLEIINNEIDSENESINDDRNMDEYLITFLRDGDCTEINKELSQCLQVELTPLHISKPIHIKPVTGPEMIGNELPINWYVLPTPVYSSFEDIHNCLPLIRFSCLLKSILEGYLFKSEDIWMLNTSGNRLCLKNELYSLPYNYITSMYLLYFSEIGNTFVVKTEIEYNKCYMERIILALLCYSNISNKLFHYLQDNITTWIDYFPFLDHSFIFDGRFYRDLHSEQDQYLITLEDQIFNVNKSLAFNLFYHKRNVQHDNFFLVLLCVHRYTECSLWMYQELFKSERQENKLLAEKQLPLLDDSYISWLPIDYEKGPMTIELIIALIQPIIEKGGFIINQTIQSFENGELFNSL